MTNKTSQVKKAITPKLKYVVSVDARVMLIIMATSRSMIPISEDSCRRK